MLYIFHVDAGQMTTYDMNLTLQTVASLKAAIERKTRIPSSSLVLLVSGGEVLESDHMVSSYSAGTDTNPIYMFSKPSLRESQFRQSIGDLTPIEELSPGESRSDSSNTKSLSELKAAVDKCFSLPPTVNTVIACAGLAQKFKEIGHEVSRNCEQLVHEQHLQHQGWAAVVANLEDIYTEFCERSKNFKESFNKHRDKKEEYYEQIKALNEVLESLGKIPILPALQLNAKAHRFSAFDVFEETDFETNYGRESQRLDSSSENRNCQDFGVEAFKSSEDDVFGQKGLSTDQIVGEAHCSEAIQQIQESVTSKAPSEEKDDRTLLNWILAQGNQASLQDILDYCQKGLALLEAEPLRQREAELKHILEYADEAGLKQIKGIEDRLYGLDQLLSDVKRIERDQHDQATSLTQNRDRLSPACDPSVLPTLVQSHCCQLDKLFKGHQILVDIRRRIAKSKEELSHILKARLEAVLMIENSMSVQDAHAMLSFQCCGRLARYLDIVAQLHRAPAVFVRAVHEVARRRTFSHHYLTWATDLSEKLLKIHEEEVSRRQEFYEFFKGHFLKSLFPGMTELPPTFATQAPTVFDAKLPKLTDADIQYISEAFPELAKDVPVYDMDSVVMFFEQRLKASEQDKQSGDTEDRIIESETETGDFEKLSAHKQKIDISTICVPDTMAVSTVTEVRTLPVILEIEEVPLKCDEFENSEFYIEESLPSSLDWGRDERQDNMDTHKINIEKLQEYLVKLFTFCKENIAYVRSELDTVKNEIEEEKKFIFSKYLELLKAWEKNNEENALKFREQTQRLTVDHELEMSDMKATLNNKDESIEALRKTKEELKIEHRKAIERLEKERQSVEELLERSREENKALQAKLEEEEAQKQKELKELQEKLGVAHKAEVESLRNRFRLVALTNMDRSPSESSLEKIERTDVIEINNHNAIVRQTKENAELEKEEAVKEAVKNCEIEWQKKLNEEVVSMRNKFASDKQMSINDVTKRLLAEKDRQLELLREREQVLSRECTKYRETIQQLTDPDTNECDGVLRCQLTTLENEKLLLQQQVLDLKKELEKKEESDKEKKEDNNGRSSPKKEERKKSRNRSHTPYGLTSGTIKLSSCLPDDTVLVMWDPAHVNYTVMQEAPIMYFVDSDSLSALGLSIQVDNESDRRLYAIGVVESKDYCYAKKSGNRYRMPCGSRFYRVRVRPRSYVAPPACCEHRHKHDAMKGSVLSVLGEKRPLKKWLTYMHAPDIQKSAETCQSTCSTAEDSKVAEVATATLINLESPVSTSEAASSDQPDSIETSEHFLSARMSMSTAILPEMECSVGQCRESDSEPLELTVSAVSVVARGSVPPGSEIAEEASP